MKGRSALTPRAAPSSFSSTTMRALVLVTVHMALLTATLGTDLEDKKVRLKKCCDVHQMLSADGESCVEAGWPRNFSIRRDRKGLVVPPLDSAWVRRWLPPGLPMENIRKVITRSRGNGNMVSAINASALWDPALLENEDIMRFTVVFLGEDDYIARPRPGGGIRKAGFCVDAARPPLGPFAMRFQTICSQEECAKKCCTSTELMRNNDGHWQCEEDVKGFWTPNKSTLTVFDPEFPYTYYGGFENPRLSPNEERYAEWARHTGGIHHFHFSTWDICLAFYRSSNGSLKEGLFLFEYSRITRGVYRLLRPLCILSALLLTASLLSIACNKSMRRNTHGRCLASHAACLLAFNIGQTVYYIAISDRLDEKEKVVIPADLQTACKYFALSMYFVLIAAWIWLTALCVNMVRGFRLHVARLNSASGKRFLAISTFAWGLPAVLTIACSILFTQPEGGQIPAWHTPSLMETRVCYIEPLYGPSGNFNIYIFNEFDLAINDQEVPFMKSGTALFYYGPVCGLVVCNIVSLALTLRKVHYLKRGNSVLRREEDQVPLGQRHAAGNSPPTAHTATGKGQTRAGRNRSSATVDAKTIKLYIKMVLISGGIELITEVIMWLTTHENFEVPYGTGQTSAFSQADRDMAYRAAGYVTDFFRAAVVTWLAAPEGGYLSLIMKSLRRDKREKKPAGAGNAGRRKQNVA